MGTIRAHDARIALEYLAKAHAAAESILPALQAQNIFVAGVPTATGTITGSIKIVQDILGRAAFQDIQVEPQPQEDAPC